MDPQSEQIALDRINDGDNVRRHYDEQALLGLSQSIRECGLQQPIHLMALSDGRYSVISGSRRLRAARNAALQGISAIVHRSLSNADILLLQITENLQREDLTPTEKAKAIESLMKEAGWTASQCASKLGLTNGTVSKLLSLLSLSEELQQRIDAGNLPASAAYQLSKVDDPKVQNALASRVSSGELTRDQLSGAIKATKRRQRRPRKARLKQVTAKLENSAKVSISAPGLDLNSFVEIIEKLLNHAQQARNEGLTLEALLKHLATKRAPVMASTKTL